MCTYVSVRARVLCLSVCLRVCACVCGSCFCVPCYVLCVCGCVWLDWLKVTQVALETRWSPSQSASRLLQVVSQQFFAEDRGPQGWSWLGRGGSVWKEAEGWE